jgi:hypothetical protein
MPNRPSAEIAFATLTKRHRGLPVLVVLLAGCTQPPDRVFVPGSPFTHVVEVRTAQGVTAAVKTGQWFELHARRQTGAVDR